MATTVAEALARLARIFPEIDDVGSSTVKLELMNTVHRDLCHMLPLDIRPEDINLTLGVSEYDLDSDDSTIWSAELRSSDTSVLRLLATDWQTLNTRQPYWREEDGNSLRYAIWRDETKIKLYLWPAPGTTTTGGFPFVRLWVTRVTALTAMGNLPLGLRTPDIYVFGAAMRHCMEQNMMDRYTSFKKLYDETLQMELDAVRDKSVQSPSIRTPNIIFPNVVRR